MREETQCCHMGYSFWLAARVLLYAPSHSHGALAGTRNSSMCQRWRIDPTIHRTMSECSYHGATSRSLTGSDYVCNKIINVLNQTFEQDQWEHTDSSVEPTHHQPSAATLETAKQRLKCKKTNNLKCTNFVTDWVCSLIQTLSHSRISGSTFVHL